MITQTKGHLAKQNFEFTVVIISNLMGGSAPLTL